MGLKTTQREEEGRASDDGQVAGTIHQFRGDRQETGDWERFLRYLFIYLISRIPLMASGQEAEKGFFERTFN